MAIKKSDLKNHEPLTFKIEFFQQNISDLIIDSIESRIDEMVKQNCSKEYKHIKIEIDSAINDEFGILNELKSRYEISGFDVLIDEETSSMILM